MQRTATSLRRYAWVCALGLGVLVLTVMLLVKQGGSGATQASPMVRSASTPTSVPVASACADNSTSKRIVVSLAQQHMWLCERSTVVDSSPVTTGRSAIGHGTPTGSWSIVSHETGRYLEGPGYRVHVNFWLPFFGDVGFHDSPWQKFPYGDLQKYKTGGSQGCVHVPGPMMAKLYDWTRVGTAVTVTA
nr:L,D-transpeptidase [Gordonia humi]